MSHAVLIIEDEATLARNMETYLRRHGYSVTTVSSGEEGLAQLDACRPDVVLLDYQLPRMNGLEVLVRLQNRERRIPAIMITGQGSRDVADQALMAGVYAYRSKPVALSDLSGLVAGALGS